MRENKNGMVGWFWVLLLVICFAVLIVSTGQAYSYSDCYDWDEEWSDEESPDEYDYAGQWHEIPEPDPYPVSYGYAHRRSPISMMMPLFIVFFVVFLPWLAYALGKE